MNSDDSKFNISNIKFNIFAFLFQGLWLLYHKLYLCFFIVLGLFIALEIFVITIATPIYLCLAILLMPSLVLGLWGEEIKRCIQASRAKIYKIRGYNEEEIEELLKPSFTAPKIFISVCGFIFLIIMHFIQYLITNEQLLK